jgi:hypothetical protein
VVGNHRDALAEVHQAADAIDITNAIQAFADVASDKYVTGKKWFNDAHYAPPGGPFYPQAGMKYLQTEVPLQSSRHNVLVFRLCPRAIPGKRTSFRWNSRCLRLRRKDTTADISKLVDCAFKYRHKNLPTENRRRPDFWGVRDSITNPPPAKLVANTDFAVAN